MCVCVSWEFGGCKHQGIQLTRCLCVCVCVCVGGGGGGGGGGVNA